jgi:hypothetical protein
MAKAKKKIPKLDETLGHPVDLMNRSDFMSAILQAAENHGNEGEPDMEVGDLQDVIWDLWDALPSGCRDVLMASEKWREFIADHDGAEGVS